MMIVSFLWFSLFLAGLAVSEHEFKRAVLSNVNSLSDVVIECNSNSIRVTIKMGEDFNGMIYPKGLSENSSCLSEYEHAGSKIIYTLPLRSCNTMSHDTKEGVEFYNTVVVQPHHKLVTALGKGYQVRCRYTTRNKTIASNVAIGTIRPTSMLTDAPLPNVMMKIYMGRSENHVIAEHVKIGDYLTLVINIDEQGVFGMKVTNCIVRDGLNWSEQPLINNDGCPIDEEIMGPFEYSKNLTVGRVTYPAHKFPFTSSVYYQCSVKLCLKQLGDCYDVPPVCDVTGHNIHRRRRKRQSDDVDTVDLVRQDEEARDRSVEVFSGLYVNEVDDVEDETETLIGTADSDDNFCVSTRKFAIGIAIAGVILTLAVILLVACIVHRRRRRKGASTAGSSIYSGPYSNHAYAKD